MANKNGNIVARQDRITEVRKRYFDDRQSVSQIAQEMGICRPTVYKDIGGVHKPQNTALRPAEAAILRQLLLNYCEGNPVFYAMSTELLGKLAALAGKEN